MHPAYEDILGQIYCGELSHMACLCNCDPVVIPTLKNWVRWFGWPATERLLRQFCCQRPAAPPPQQPSQPTPPEPPQPPEPPAPPTPPAPPDPPDPPQENKCPPPTAAAQVTDNLRPTAASSVDTKSPLREFPKRYLGKSRY